MNKAHKKNLGISLLECLLAITLIASITMLAVRYYIITLRNTHVSQAIAQVNRLTSASYEWLRIQNQSDFSGEDTGTSITIQLLLDAELIKPNTDTIDPWGGAITITPGITDPSYVAITLSNIPQQDCLNLTQQLQYINHSQTTNTCGAASTANQFTGEF